MQRETVGRPMDILLVEDSVPAARIAIGTLKNGDFHHRLTWLRDGQDASDFLRNQGVFAHAPRPDLILLDLGLPGKDGRDVLAETKADDNLRDIPIVIMTSSTDQTDIVRSENLSVEAYLIKPVDLKKFQKLVRKLKRFWKEDMVVPPSGVPTVSDYDINIMPIEIG
ncbi:MAG: response regulator [Planctomycetaceae bacterium]|nr:response regulator [Planctomycetaceae bacterium]